MKQLLLLIGLAGLLLSSCTDPREDNIFDAANAFVRFNYDNTVAETARDEVDLDRTTSDTLLLPIALSAPPQPTAVRIDLALTTTGALERGDNLVLLTEAGEPFTDDAIRLEPGDFDYVLRIALAEPLAEPATLTLEITATDPAFLLGFPGSGRGRIFKINYE